MMPVLRRLFPVAVMAVASFISPNGGAAQGGLCDPSRVLQILSDVSHRFEGTGPALERSGSDAALLAHVVRTARLKVVHDSDPARRLDRIEARMSKAGTRPRTPAPTLTTGERQYFDWWTSACTQALPVAGDASDPAGSGNFTSAAGNTSPAAAARGSAGAPVGAALRAADRPNRQSSPDPLIFSGGLVGLIMATLAGALAVAFYATERDNRAAVRHPCHARSRIRVGSASSPVLMVDISRLGCKIQFDQPPTVQKVCEVWIDGRYRPGRILWSNRHCAGIRLDKTLDRNAVRATIRSDDRGAGARPPTPAGERQSPRHARVPA